MDFVENIIRLNNRTSSEWNFKRHISGKINVCHRIHSNKFQMTVEEFLIWFKKYSLKKVQQS